MDTYDVEATSTVLGRTPKRRRPIGALLAMIGMVAALCWPTAAGAQVVELDPVEAEFVAMLNETRAQQGLPALRVDPDLTMLARGWSERMREAGGLSHNPNYTTQVTVNWSKLGENVGLGPDPRLIHQKFVESPLHYRNMVDPQFDSVGMGVVYAGDLVYVTQSYMGMTPSRAPAAARPAGAPQALALTGATTGRAPALGASLPVPVAPVPVTAPAKKTAVKPTAAKKAAVRPAAVKSAAVKKSAPAKRVAKRR